MAAGTAGSSCRTTTKTTRPAGQPGRRHQLAGPRPALLPDLLHIRPADRAVAVHGAQFWQLADCGTTRRRRRIRRLAGREEVAHPRGGTVVSGQPGQAPGGLDRAQQVAVGAGDLRLEPVGTPPPMTSVATWSGELSFLSQVVSSSDRRVVSAAEDRMLRTATGSRVPPRAPGSADLRSGLQPRRDRGAGPGQI